MPVIISRGRRIHQDRKEHLPSMRIQFLYSVIKLRWKSRATLLYSSNDKMRMCEYLQGQRQRVRRTESIYPASAFPVLVTYSGANSPLADVFCTRSIGIIDAHDHLADVSCTRRALGIINAPSAGCILHPELSRHY
jgi:hypothetical protein